MEDDDGKVSEIITNFTLLHHAAHKGNLEAISYLSTLPYFKEIIDDSSNEVSDIH